MTGSDDSGSDDVDDKLRDEGKDGGESEVAGASDDDLRNRSFNFVIISLERRGCDCSKLNCKLFEEEFVID